MDQYHFTLPTSQRQGFENAVDTFFTEIPYDEQHDKAQIIETMLVVSDEFAYYYDRQSEPRQDVIISACAPGGRGKQHIMPAAKRSASLRETYSGSHEIARSAKDLLVQQRAAREDLLLNGDTIPTIVSVMQRAAVGELAIGAKEFQFSTGNEVVDVHLRRGEEMTSLRVWPQAGVARFDEKLPVKVQSHQITTLTVLLGLVQATRQQV